MSDSTGRLIPPSEAYEESAGGFRIPEATLGSFFVGYGLGFYPLLTQLATQSHGRLGAVLVGIQYVSISVTFIFLTVTFYAKYRAEILTMPQVELNRPGMDLILAITGLLAFAFSMAAPWLFPILLGSNLLLTAVRQNKEYDALASLFYEVLCKRSLNGGAYHKFRNALKRYFRVVCKRSRNGNKYDAFRAELKRHLRNHAFSELSGWGPTGRGFWFGSAAMLAVGLIVRIILIPLNTNWKYQQSLIAAEGAAVMVTVTIKCFAVLRRRATFILSRGASILNQMDEKYDCLKAKLVKLCLDRVTS